MSQFICNIMLAAQITGVIFFMASYWGIINPNTKRNSFMMIIFVIISLCQTFAQIAVDASNDKDSYFTILSFFATIVAFTLVGLRFDTIPDFSEQESTEEDK